VKIVDLETVYLSCPLEEPLVYARGEARSRDIILVLVHTDVGLTGIGECHPADAPLVITAVLEKGIKACILGEDPLFIERIWEKMYNNSLEYGRKGAAIIAMSGVDIALWDILGKMTNLPIYKLLGAYQEKVRTYASGGYYHSKLEGLAEEMSGYVREGFSAVKMKMGKADFRADIERVKTVREAIGDNIDLIIDANSAWSVPTAIRIMKKLEKYDVLFLEEPVSPDDIEGYAKINATIAVPLAAGENAFTRYGFRDLIQARAVEILMPDATWCGGISESKKIFAMAGAHNMLCAPHSFDSAISLAANLHVGASASNCSFVELDRTWNPFISDLLTEPIYIDGEGYARVPQKLGLGLELNEETVDKYRIEI
jgi:L-alanine-DL-glutamate epimerase-like enolase superfamily enzyme